MSLSVIWPFLRTKAAFQQVVSVKSPFLRTGVSDSSDIRTDGQSFCPDCKSQPVTRSKTEGGAQMIVLQCFTTTRVGLEMYPFKSKLLTISDFCSTSNVGKQASGAAHPESSPCIRPMHPAHASGPCIRCAAKKDILLSLPYETYYERMDNSGKTVVHAGVCDADNRNSRLPVLEGC